MPVDHQACHKTNELPSLRPSAAPSTTASEMQAKISAVKINESVGSKMNMVTKHITLLLNENPSVKVHQSTLQLQYLTNSRIIQRRFYAFLNGILS